MDTVRGIWLSSSGSYVGYHETAAAVGDSSEKYRVVKNKANDSSENEKENRDVDNTDKVATSGSQKKNNKIKHGDSWLDHEQVIRAQGCTSAAALDLDSNRDKNGEMGCNVLSPIDLSSPMKLYIRASISEFQSGGQSVIAAAKLDINTPNNSAKANTNKVFTTTTASYAIAMASDAIAFHHVVASTNMASATIAASDTITILPATASSTIVFRPATASITVASAIITVSECVAVHPKMAAVVVHSAVANTTTIATLSDCIAVSSPKAVIIFTAKPRQDIHQ
jgi:hypothetical protein